MIVYLARANVSVLIRQKNFIKLLSFIKVLFQFQEKPALTNICYVCSENKKKYEKTIFETIKTNVLKTDKQL